MRLLVCVVVAGVALAALDAASANQTASGRFLVTVRATVTKKWSYATASTSAGCTTKTQGSGTRTISLRTDEAIVNGRWAGGTARAKFVNPVRGVAGSVTQTGTKTTKTSGVGCTPGRKFNCARKDATLRKR